MSIWNQKAHIYKVEPAISPANDPRMGVSTATTGDPFAELCGAKLWTTKSFKTQSHVKKMETKVVSLPKCSETLRDFHRMFVHQH